MAEMIAAFPAMFGSAGAGAAGAGSAIPAGMATAGGMASGVGTAGAVGGGSALPGALSTLGTGMMSGAGVGLGGKLASSLFPSQPSAMAAPHPMGGFSMQTRPIGDANPSPVPAIGSGGNGFSTPPGQLEAILRALQRRG